MPQVSSLIETLKKQLKLHGKTYADVAQALSLSEASVKRLFADENFTLQRLETICELIEMDISELVQTMAVQQRQITELSEAQEREIAGDGLLLLVAVCVINGYSFTNIIEQYRLTPAECIQQLVRLDRLKLIELLPGNRIRLLISRDFRWRPAGPIQQFFQKRVAHDFFQSRFDSEAEKLLVLNGLLSRAGNAQWQQKLQRLAREFNELCRDEADLPIKQRFGTTTVLAVRQWRYGLFERYSTR
ncbi:Cro/C1-type helix-turn-helix DNA-binding protein [Pseudomonas duriflava]|uniref:Cro/C1-type helix-turn-helix DNA-binding protein n=1 Tax=Pseudomonas duriflava TaxID=459528 RepID=A0A562QIB8_9PSED|nr:helix-turn-helix transcriptional regulator [Pseudomonas duriflava]TWI56479.1 Cro/C1-type helix-turn-helix DNA-binding protein [Pseudomonas duriflava]